MGDAHQKALSSPPCVTPIWSTPPLRTHETTATWTQLPRRPGYLEIVKSHRDHQLSPEPASSRAASLPTTVAPHGVPAHAGSLSLGRFDLWKAWTAPSSILSGTCMGLLGRHVGTAVLQEADDAPACSHLTVCGKSFQEPAVNPTVSPRVPRSGPSLINNSLNMHVSNIHRGRSAENDVEEQGEPGVEVNGLEAKLEAALTMKTGPIVILLVCSIMLFSGCIIAT